MRKISIGSIRRQRAREHALLPQRIIILLEGNLEYVHMFLSFRMKSTASVWGVLIVVGRAWTDARCHMDAKHYSSWLDKDVF